MTPQIRALLVLAAFTMPLAACPSGTQGFAFVSGLNGAYRAEGPVGSTFIVEGIQFGDVQGASNVFFTNSLGVVALAAPVSQWANNFIVGTVPTGAVSGPISVNNGNGANLGITAFSVTPQGPFNPAALTLTAAGALPGGVSGHAMAFTTISGTSPTRVIYAVGGADNSNTPGTGVYYSTVPALGQIGGWNGTTALPLGVAFHAAVVASPGNSAVNNTTGYLLVLGGITSATGTSTAAIYRAALNANGTVGTWSQAGSLPTPLHSFGATIFLGHLYVVGGANSSNVPVATVYRAVIQPDGSLGAWNTETALPAPRAHFGFGQFNGYLYVIGGDAGTTAPNDTTSSSALQSIVYAPVDLYTRQLKSGWTTVAAGLPATRMAEAAVVAGAPGAGRILVSGGVYSGAPTNEELYATISANGAPSSFTTAGTGTLNALCSGCDPFNHAAAGYFDGSGNFHVVVAGGDDRNALGTKRAETATY